MISLATGKMMANRQAETCKGFVCQGGPPVLLEALLPPGRQVQASLLEDEGIEAPASSDIEPDLPVRLSRAATVLPYKFCA